MNTKENVIKLQTQKWITDIVIGCNFCPFAAREVKRNAIHYAVEISDKIKVCLDSFLNECILLDENKDIETSLLIFPGSFKRFDDYLILVSKAENLLKKKDYEGIYQVASFHPTYCFANSPMDDAANFTNRSPYPMLHILREESIEQALLHYPNPKKIPENNIDFARKKGFAYMALLLDACLKK
ncbi:MAG: DUF1415 domain-containing protein [Bacteroidota bacterium]|nr:DUF1415 domain-containing protein [Bacteroidota bacterium]